MEQLLFWHLILITILGSFSVFDKVIGRLEYRWTLKDFDLVFQRVSATIDPSKPSQNWTSCRQLRQTTSARGVLIFQHDLKLTLPDRFASEGVDAAKQNCSSSYASDEFSVASKSSSDLAKINFVVVQLL